MFIIQTFKIICLVFFFFKFGLNEKKDIVFCTSKKKNKKKNKNKKKEFYEGKMKNEL